MTKDNKIYFRVDKAVFDWWDEKCKKEGVKKGEPFQKAIEAAYLKDHEKSNLAEVPVTNNFYLKDEVKGKILEEARKVGKDPDTLLNEILLARYAVNNQIEVHALEKTTFKAFRLKPSFLKKVEEAAQRSNMRTTRFVVSVLTAKISKDEFFFNAEEEQILGESNSRLLAIGRNLNQMTKAMNQDIYEAYDRQFIADLNEQIRGHVKHIFSLLERNKRRWE